jgi:hypothetical protein
MGIGIGWSLCSLSREDLLYRTALTALHIKYFSSHRTLSTSRLKGFSPSLSVCACVAGHAPGMGSCTIIRNAFRGDVWTLDRRYSRMHAVDGTEHAQSGSR